MHVWINKSWPQSSVHWMKTAWRARPCFESDVPSSAPKALCLSSCPCSKNEEDQIAFPSEWSLLLLKLCWIRNKKLGIKIIEIGEVMRKWHFHIRETEACNSKKTKSKRLHHIEWQNFIFSRKQGLSFFSIILHLFLLYLENYQL